MTIPPTPILTEVIIKIMVELLSVLALATKQIKQGRFSECTASYILAHVQRVTEKFVKKLFGKDKIQAIFEKLDRLTKNEGLSAGAQTLGVVHGLADNMKVVMRGAPYIRDFL